MKKTALVIAFSIATCALGIETGNAVAISNPHSSMAMPSMYEASKAEIGSPAPRFTLNGVVDLEIKKVALGDYKGKWVVLFFYPGDFTFV